jgi:amidase
MSAGGGPRANGSDGARELWWSSARELARLQRERRVSAVEMLEAHLERIERHNPSLNAVVSLDPDRARERAEAADAALARGEVWGPLHGVPMTLKDAFDVAGLRTTVGTGALDRVPSEDGVVAARLRAAGAIILGHTNVPPWLADYQSANPIFGRSANPWDLERTPGGSSGGAAAALAAGLTPLEVGSDLAGSCRLPPHFCGVYGLKTTEHRVPDTGFFRLPEGTPRSVRILGGTGPLARDLDDLELALAIIAGPDGRDGEIPPVPVSSERGRPVEGLRLAVAPTLPGVTVARDIQETIERVSAAAADAGAVVEARLPEVDWEGLLQLYGDIVMTVTGLFDPTANLPEEHRTLAWYLSALDLRDRFVSLWEAFFDDLDGLIVPPAMTTAFTHREPGASLEIDGWEADYGANGHPLVIFNLTGQPGLVVPAGQDRDGLPIGIQFVGPRWSEMRLLAVARALEEAGILPGFRPPPGY